MGVRINQVVMAAATGKYLAVVVCNPRNRGNRGEHGTVQLLNERLNRLGAFPGTGGTWPTGLVALLIGQMLTTGSCPFAKFPCLQKSSLILTNYSCPWYNHHTAWQQSIYGKCATTVCGSRVAV